MKKYINMSIYVRKVYPTVILAGSDVSSVEYTEESADNKAEILSKESFGFHDDMDEE